MDEALLYLEDELKEGAREGIGALKEMGYRVILISGDRFENVEAVSRQVGIEEFIANAKPEDKLRKIRELSERGGCCMVGDGINDAPVLSESDMGIAVGRATDLAILAGDIIIVRGDVDIVPQIIKTARKTRLRIVQNLFWAFLYNSVLIPIATTGYIPPELSALAMGMSSITVVLNSIR